MYRLLLSFSLLIFSIIGTSQKYTPADAGSKVHFVIRNFGIKTGGGLSGLKGIINFVPSNLDLCNSNVSVDVSSIDTDNGMRDKDLKGEKYFNLEKYPVITIKSTKINKTNKTDKGWYNFTGNLTIRGVTKTISFPFTATSQGNDYLFVGGFEINRLDFGVGKNSSVLSNTVKVSLSVLARKT
ncbi:MAG: YceI family protein [Ginsengibacter sp.]